MSRTAPIETAIPFSDSIIAFDVQAASGDFDADLVVRAALSKDNESLDGYRFALPSPAASNREHWMRAPATDVTTLAEHQIGIAADAAWHHVTVTCNGRRLTLNIDGAGGGEYEVRELGGVFAFTAQQGLGYIRNLDVKARDFSSAGTVPPMLVDDIKKNGGREPRLVGEVRPQYSGNAMRAGVQGLVKLKATVQTDGTVTDIKWFDISTMTLTTTALRPSDVGSSVQPS